MAGEYQETSLYQEHTGNIKVTGEFSIPELADLVTAPMADNAIGMKEGVQYKWNRISNKWEPAASDGNAIEHSGPVDTESITSTFMTATYPEAKTVAFTNLTDLPNNVMVVTKTAAGEWYANLYANKLP